MNAKRAKKLRRLAREATAGQPGLLYWAEYNCRKGVLTDGGKECAHLQGGTLVHAKESARGAYRKLKKEEGRA